MFVRVNDIFARHRLIGSLEFMQLSRMENEELHSNFVFRLQILQSWP